MLQKLSNWSEDVPTYIPYKVAPSRMLREPRADIVQYWKKGRELLAVKQREPYGKLMGHNALSEILMDVEGCGADYTLFAVSEDTLSLGAITRGTGRNNALLLTEIYHRVGQVARETVRQVDTPPLTVDDFAVERQTGNVLLVPPVAFGEGTRDLDAHTKSLVESMRTRFSALWMSAATFELTRQVTMGAMHDGRSA